MLISKHIKFRVQASELSGILEKSRDEIDSIVMVLHPHPLYGGSMHNPVVNTLVNTFLDAGFATFRFDFRGVKKRSTYAGILGAIEDATAASDTLESHGLKLSGIAGYSFGGSAALRFSSTNQVDFVVSVSSSLALYEEDGYEASHLSKIECPVLLIHGVSDLAVPYQNMIDLSSQIHSEVKCVSIENEGHFYHHSLAQVQNEVKSFLSTIEFQ